MSRVENRSPAIGGAEAETLEDAKARGPLLLRSRGRAVTAADFEELARDVAPEIARAHCVTEAGSGVRCSSCRMWPSDEIGRIARPDLEPPCQVLERITDSLNQRCLVGTRAAGIRRITVADGRGGPELASRASTPKRCVLMCCGRSTGSTIR